MNISIKPNKRHQPEDMNTEWLGSDGISIARFGGQKMVAYYEPYVSGCKLYYMGMVTHFDTFKDAKKAAPTFARSVLWRLMGTIKT